MEFQVKNLSLKIVLAQNNRKLMILKNLNISICISTISRITLNKKINVYILKKNWLSTNVH